MFQRGKQDVQTSNTVIRNTLPLIIGIVLIASNMRGPITAVGPLVDQICSSLHISGTLAGMLTTLPLFAFALFSPAAPVLARRYGTKTTLLFAVAVLTVGILVRSWPGNLTIFVGTSLIGLAICICNVLIPSLIKRDFPEQIGIMTGIFSVSMSSFGAVGSGLSIPIALALGWPGALRIWALLSFLSCIVWLPQAVREGREKRISEAGDRNSGTAGNIVKISLLKSPVALQITFYSGFQSMMFYCLIAWLPDILMQKGIVSNQAGFMLSAMQISSIPVIFLGSVLAGNKSNHKTLVLAGSLCYIIGLSGMLFTSGSITYIWAVLFGIAGGFTFSLSMMYISMRTRTADQAASLSGMAQSIGYMLAAFGPMLFGYLRDTINDWRAPVYIMILVACCTLTAGLFAARDRYVI